MWAIANWTDVFDYADLSFVLNEDGTVMLFEDRLAASFYAREELNGTWRLINLGQE